MQRIYNALTTLTSVLILILILITPFFYSCNREKEEWIIGVKIYDHRGSFEELFDQWGELGINTALTSESLQSNKEFRTLARENEITTFVIFPVFYNPEILADSPDMHAITQHGEPAVEEWVEFVCPSRDTYRKQAVDHAVEIIQDYNPDGISIDFIRHFVFWEKVYPDRDPASLPETCFDSSCMVQFQAKTG
ncbi:MAG: hypothetical protein KAT15_14115, partial [Bacteroidales bacterium]|nr:hypothetical protein [Bacteroidales bacterium]